MVKDVRPLWCSMIAWLNGKSLYRRQSSRNRDPIQQDIYISSLILDVMTNTGGGDL